MNTVRTALFASLAAAALAVGSHAQTYTPAEFRVTLYEVAMSTDGVNYQVAMSNPNGLAVDLANPATFGNAFGAEAAIPVGTYEWIRLTLGQELVWSHPTAPVSLSNQNFVVQGGPPGPSPGQMAVHFATFAEGGRPNGQGSGEGTAAKPFLLGQGARIDAGTDTTLRIVFLVTDTLQDRGVGQNPRYDLAPPQMFFVTENGDASQLSGMFNTVLYNTHKEVAGSTVNAWDYMSGHGALAFDGTGAWTWAGTSNDFDLSGGATGSLNASATQAGRYGVNDDGSFWMIANGDSGTLRGALSSDGTMVVATMYDSPTSHLMIFGTRQATSASVASMSGGYYYTIYGTRYDSGNTRLEYHGSFGVVTGDGLGGITGTQDKNELRVQNPLSATPTITGPLTLLNDPFTGTLAVNANGTMSEVSGDMAGGILQSGDAGCIGFSFAMPYDPSNQFGFLVRQSTAGTFNDASLNGTYFGGHFGDRYDSGGGTTLYYSGFFQIAFNGAGGAAITLVENREGLVSHESFAQTYSVDVATGLVAFSDPGGGASDLVGAIGPNAMSFLLNSQQESSGQPNDQRFLGLGLKQQ